MNPLHASCTELEGGKHKELEGTAREPLKGSLSLLLPGFFPLSLSFLPLLLRPSAHRGLFLYSSPFISTAARSSALFPEVHPHGASPISSVFPSLPPFLLSPPTFKDESGQLSNKRPEYANPPLRWIVPLTHARVLAVDVMAGGERIHVSQNATTRALLPIPIPIPPLLDRCTLGAHGLEVLGVGSGAGNVRSLPVLVRFLRGDGAAWYRADAGRKVQSRRALLRGNGPPGSGACSYSPPPLLVPMQGFPFLRPPIEPAGLFFLFFPPLREYLTNAHPSSIALKDTLLSRRTLLFRLDFLPAFTHP
ncbi:hypothetical protein B0H13DRAFT_2653874 [Mycena leptocephala]|nr:hypothetical protein B0H13DRAFT_2653874 [Mycena leptocephala]